MIRINLLGQVGRRPARRPVDTGAALPAVFIGARAGAWRLFLFYFYYFTGKAVERGKRHDPAIAVGKDATGADQAAGGSVPEAKAVLQQRVSTIEQLQRDRTGGQELLDMVANTVSRTENLWLTTMTRKGDTLTLEGSSASINSVANFITAMKRSGYFQKVEIKESKQDDQEHRGADVHVQDHC